MSDALAGTAWVLEHGHGLELPDGVAPTLMFADGRAAGSTGCNRYTAGYSVDGESLELAAIASTRMACAPPLDTLERAFLDALDRVTGWRLDAATLTLADDAGAELLRFAPT